MGPFTPLAPHVLDSKVETGVKIWWDGFYAPIQDGAIQHPDGKVVEFSVERITSSWKTSSSSFTTGTTTYTTKDGKQFDSLKALVDGTRSR